MRNSGSSSIEFKIQSRSSYIRRFRRRFKQRNVVNIFPSFCSGVLIGSILMVLLTALLKDSGIIDIEKALSQIQSIDPIPWSWRDCEVAFGANRTDALYRQLVDVVEVFHDHKVAHIMAYGTLIGVMRDHSMNPFEVDNDIVLLDPSLNDVFPPEIHRDLLRKGLILFKTDIWRICRRSTSGQRFSDDVPWGMEYFPYTDVYPINWVQQNDGEFQRFFMNADDDQIEYRNLGEILVATPSDQFADEWLKEWYQNWREAPREHMKYGVWLADDGEVAW